MTLVAALGRDEFGDEAAAALESQGVGTGSVARLADTPTGVALILVDAAGENLISLAPGANGALGVDHVRAALAAVKPGPGDVVIVNHEIPTATVREALRLGRDGGALTVLNPAPAGGLDRPILALADVLTPNRGELATLAGADARRSGRHTSGAEDPIMAARSLLDATSEGPGVRHAVLVSLGAAGAALVRRDAPTGRHRLAAGHRRGRDRRRRHPQRRPRRRPRRRAGPRGGRPARGRRGEPVGHPPGRTRGDADARGARGGAGG